jgi:hypothetical protein
MVDDQFVGYVGDRDFHDGSIVSIRHEGDKLQVTVEGYSGRKFLVEFGGVESVTSNRPEGMLLYALAEMKMIPPLRKFVFSN